MAKIGTSLLTLHKVVSDGGTAMMGVQALFIMFGVKLRRPESLHKTEQRL